MSTEQMPPVWDFGPERLDVEAIARRAAAATVGHNPGQYGAPTVQVSWPPAVLVTAESTEAALRVLSELNAAGYAATRGQDAASVVVTGWDADRLELRTDCLAQDIAQVEAARYDEAREVLAIYQDQLAQGAHPELARVAVDQHLRDRADDEVPEYRSDDTDEPAEREGRWGRRSYLPMIGAREVAAFGPAEVEDEEDLTGEQVAAAVELEAAAEELAARRYQVADEVLARYDALSGAGVPMPREQALDELRHSIWSGADQAVHARGSSGALWQARLDLLDDLRTEQQRAQARWHLATNPTPGPDISTNAHTNASVDGAGSGAEGRTESGSDRAEQRPDEVESDDSSEAAAGDWEACERAVGNAAGHVRAGRTERDEQQRTLGAELYEFLASHHTHGWADDHTDDPGSTAAREDGTEADPGEQR
jgi:hypothetical protein